MTSQERSIASPTGTDRDYQTDKATARAAAFVLPERPMSRRVISGFAFTAMALFAIDPAGADVAAGKTKAAMCAVCRGLNGVAKNPDAPNLAGDNANYLRKQLHAFKSGARQDPQMSIIAGGLSDDDIANLAAWYSALKVTVEMPQ